MNRKQQDIAYFISFCIEHYKHSKNMSGEAVMTLFSQYGVLEYLQEFFFLSPYINKLLNICQNPLVALCMENIEEFLKVF